MTDEEEQVKEVMEEEQEKRVRMFIQKRDCLKLCRWIACMLSSLGSIAASVSSKAPLREEMCCEEVPSEHCATSIIRLPRKADVQAPRNLDNHCLKLTISERCL